MVFVNKEQMACTIAFILVRIKKSEQYPDFFILTNVII